MQLSGWGRYPTAIAEIIEPVSQKSAQSHFLNNARDSHIIARGSGRSYGDSALADQVLKTRFLDNFISLDTAKNTITCGSGVQLKDILNLVIPTGHFPPVLPGTKYITVGGAIAADIHGKNHHQAGSFCQHLVSLELLLASGEIVECSRSKKKDLFLATCGGMGLTGVILNATIILKKVTSASIDKKTQVAGDLRECMDIFDESEESEYSVAWLDALAQGKTGEVFGSRWESQRKGIAATNFTKRAIDSFDNPNQITQQIFYKTAQRTTLSVSSNSTKIKESQL